MAELRAATPADAKAVFDSIAAAGGKPSTRRVADALEASGQFLPIGHNTIARWKRAGWTRTEKHAQRQPGPVEAADKLDTKVPTLTGDPTTRTKNVVRPTPSAPSGDGNQAASTEQSGALSKLPKYEDFEGVPSAELAVRANRDAYITNIILYAHIRANLKLIEERPREMGALQDALAGTLVHTNKSFLDLCERAMKVIPGTAVTVDEADPLQDVWDIFDKKSA